MAVHSWRVRPWGWIDTFNIVKRCLVRTSEPCWQLCETLKIWEQNIEVTPGQSGVKSLTFTPAWPKSEVMRCGKSSPGLTFLIMGHASSGSTMTCYIEAHWSRQSLWKHHPYVLYGGCAVWVFLFTLLWIGGHHTKHVNLSFGVNWKRLGFSHTIGTRLGMWRSDRRRRIPRLGLCFPANDKQDKAGDVEHSSLYCISETCRIEYTQYEENRK